MIEDFKLKVFRVVAHMRSAQNKRALEGNCLNEWSFFRTRRGYVLSQEAISLRQKV